MWCVIEQADVPMEQLERKVGLGWVHNPPIGWPHTVEGSLLDSGGEVPLPLEVQAPDADERH
jgi:hypothetical protein